MSEISNQKGLTKRIIPCLDIKDGKTVKGVSFENLIDAGDPVELSKRYEAEGADELVFLDISASNEKRKTLKSLVKRIAQEIAIPFTVGGGINSVADAKILLTEGADKVTINTAGFKTPELITDLSKEFGSQAIVISIDSKTIDDQDLVFIYGGSKDTQALTKDWLPEAVRLGAGEILLTSINQDGQKNRYDCDLYKKFDNLTEVPMIASGGAGSMENFLEVFTQTNVSAALAASVFHFDQIKIYELKDFLAKNGIEVRR